MTDEEFLNRLAKDTGKLQAIFPNANPSEIKKMVCQQSYVRKWAYIPSGCRAEQKLPKGYRKKDGIKVKVTSSLASMTPGCILDCEGDLYVSHILYRKISYDEPWSHVVMWLVVENYRSRTLVDWTNDWIALHGNSIPNEMWEALVKFYREQDLRIGYAEPVLKSIGGRNEQSDFCNEKNAKEL